jgi:pantoate--beta-alanine ligase
MEIVNTVAEVRKIVKDWRKHGLTVGFVATMGYLHEGHKSLIEKSVLENDRTVVSIFVNPMQFGPNEDLDSYPRDLKRDASLCKITGADLIFNPEVSEIYADNFCSSVDVDNISKGLCGRSRPVHFKGVCTIVNKLFNIVTPDNAYFGEKDAQQLAVIKRMVRDLNIDINIVGCPIVREPDGLAKSSRNTYLNEEERKAALVLSRSLKMAKEKIAGGEYCADEIINLIKEKIESEPLAKIDYVEIVDSTELQPVDMIKGSVLVAIAVYIGKTRLIDNFTFNA